MGGGAAGFAGVDSAGAASLEVRQPAGAGNLRKKK
jgi:hypothetical protein